MPIFVPTQGQSAVVPLRAPQVSQVQFNPLNTLGAASLVQRGRAMDMQKELQDYQNRKLDLAEKEFVAENQRELIKMMTGQFDNYAATRKASSGDKNTSYGLDSEFYGNVIGEIDNVYNNQLKKGLQIVSTMQKPDDVAQAQSELIGHLSKSMEEVKNNTRYRDYFKNQTAFDNLFTQLSEKRKENDQVNVVEFTKLTEKMKVDNNGVQNVKSWDFLPDRYLYNEDKAMTAVKDVVSEFAQQTPIKKILDSGESFGGVTVPEGFVGKVMGRAAIDLDMVREAAYKKLKNNHDVVSMAQNIGVRTNLDEDAQIKALIDDQLQTYKNQLGETLEDIVLQNKPAATGVDKEDQAINDLRQNIIDQGFNPDPVGPESDQEALEKVKRVMDADKKGDLKVAVEDGVLTYTLTDPKEDIGDRVIAQFYPQEGEYDQLRQETQSILSGEQPQQETTNPNAAAPSQSQPGAVQPQSETNIQSDLLSNSDNIALGLVEDKESSGGKNIMNTNDSGKPSIGPLQYNGSRGKEFLDYLGIEGYDVNKPIDNTEAKKLNEELLKDGDAELIKKSREFFAEKILPDIRDKINTILPQANFDTSGAGLKSIVYSMAINHSLNGNEKIYEKAAKFLYDMNDPPDDVIVNALTEARKNYVKNTDLNPDGWQDTFKETLGWQEKEQQLRSEGASESKINEELDKFTVKSLKQRLLERYDKERAEALRLITNPPAQSTAPTSAPTEPANNWANYKKK